jgi:hypothetical protein
MLEVGAPVRLGSKRQTYGTYGWAGAWYQQAWPGVEHHAQLQKCHYRSATIGALAPMGGSIWRSWGGSSGGTDQQAHVFNRASPEEAHRE